MNLALKNRLEGTPEQLKAQERAFQLRQLAMQILARKRAQEAK